MPYVLTGDQIAARSHPDAIPAAPRTLARESPGVPLTRTVGDEFEALLTDSVSVVDAILLLVREGRWHVGVGIGPVEQPTPSDLREARGPAFLAARQAVDEAKARVDHLRVVAAPPADAAGRDAEVLLGLILALRSRRSEEGWAASDLSDDGLTQAEIGQRLGISRQAVNQRLQTARWSLDVASRAVAARLLDRAEQLTASSGAGARAGRGEVA